MSTQHNVLVFTASTVTVDLKVDRLFVHPWTFCFLTLFLGEMSQVKIPSTAFWQVQHFVPWLLSRTKKTEIVDVVIVNSVMLVEGWERGES